MAIRDNSLVRIALVFRDSRPIRLALHVGDVTQRRRRPAFRSQIRRRTAATCMAPLTTAAGVAPSSSANSARPADGKHCGNVRTLFCPTCRHFFRPRPAARRSRRLNFRSVPF